MKAKRERLLKNPNHMVRVTDRRGAFASHIPHAPNRRPYYGEVLLDPELVDLKPELTQNRAAVQRYARELDTLRSGWLGCITDERAHYEAVWALAMQPWVDARGLPPDTIYVVSSNTVDAVRAAKTREKPWRALAGVLHGALRVAAHLEPEELVVITGYLAGAPPEHPAGVADMIVQVAGYDLQYLSSEKHSGRRGVIAVGTAVDTIRRHSKGHYPW